jgi:4-hydroxy-3-methylbut-2-enyl diphosphate reductase
MNIIRAEVMGLCFGVRDALKVIDAVVDPRDVTIHGELVHNEVILSGLELRGFSMTAEARRESIPETPEVLITAHGISDRERNRLATSGKRLIDTTCPLVRRVHHAAMGLAREGCHVLVVGRRDHVEVRGIVEDLERYDVVESVEDVRKYDRDLLGIVCQTTAPSHLVDRVREKVAERNPGAEIRFVDTVCLPTKDHQRSLERLLERVEAVVVVGGRNSNNTRELAVLCRSRGVPAHHVQSAEDLDPDWFRGVETIGLTAGTSTLDRTIDDVHRALERISVEVGAV